MDIKRMKIDRIVKVMEYGATCPLHVIAEDKKDYVLKTKQALHGKNDEIEINMKDLFTEIFSYMYLHELKVDIIPEICFLEIDKDTLKMINKFENSSNARERQAYLNISNSLGLNLGVEFIQETEKVKECYGKKFINKTINYDARLMNSDRSKNNPNIIGDIQGNKWLIDFGLGFDVNNLFDELFSKGALFDNVANEEYFSKCCFDNYLFDDYRQNASIIKNKLTLDDIRKILKDIPKELNLLKNNYEKEALAQIIFQRQSNKGILYA